MRWFPPEMPSGWPRAPPGVLFNLTTHMHMYTFRHKSMVVWYCKKYYIPVVVGYSTRSLFKRLSSSRRLYLLSVHWVTTHPPSLTPSSLAAPPGTSRSFGNLYSQLATGCYCYWLLLFMRNKSQHEKFLHEHRLSFYDSTVRRSCFR